MKKFLLYIILFILLSGLFFFLFYKLEEKNIINYNIKAKNQIQKKQHIDNNTNSWNIQNSSWSWSLLLTWRWTEL